MLRFASESKLKDQTPILTIIPTCADLEYAKKCDELPYKNLSDELRSSGVMLIAFGNEILRKQPNVSPDKLYGNCSGHFNAFGYYLIAEIANEYILANYEISAIIHNYITKN